MIRLVENASYWRLERWMSEISELNPAFLQNYCKNKLNLFLTGVCDHGIFMSCLVLN